MPTDTPPTELTNMAVGLRFNPHAAWTMFWAEEVRTEECRANFVYGFCCINGRAQPFNLTGAIHD